MAALTHTASGAPVRAIRVQRFGGARDLTRGAAYCFVGLCLTIAVLRVAVEILGPAAVALGIPLAIVGVGLGIIGAVCALGSPLLWLSALLARRRPGVLRIDEGLRIDQGGLSTVLPLLSVTSARISPFEDELWLRMSDGDVVRAGIDTLEEGEQILDAVATETVRGTWLASLHGRPERPIPAWAEWPWLSALGVGALSALLAGPFVATEAALALGLSAGAAIRIAAAMRRRTPPGCVVLGRDGIAVKQADRERFIPFGTIAGVEETEAGALLTLASGEEVALDVLAPEMLKIQGEGALGLALAERRRAHLLGRLREELATSDEPPRAAALLERRGRTVVAWRDALRDLLREAAGTYRTATLAREHAIGVLEDGRAPGELRIGAALALTTTPDGKRVRGGDAETSGRLRFAVETCVNQDVRTALREAIYGDLDDETLDRAMRADVRR